VYTTPGLTTTHNGQNEPRSFKNVIGKLEASYALPASFRLTGGLEREDRKRNTSPVRSVSHRDETEETSYKLDLRRSLSETINGAVSFVHSEREGSDWLVNTRNDGSIGSNLIHPLHLADRDRDKLRLSLDWTPVERLSLQLMAEAAQDDYSGRTLGQLPVARCGVHVLREMAGARLDFAHRHARGAGHLPGRSRYAARRAGADQYRRHLPDHGRQWRLGGAAAQRRRCAGPGPQRPAYRRAGARRRAFLDQGYG
jgi:hypothetical protein